jgi:hypothetical protein
MNLPRVTCYVALLALFGCALGRADGSAFRSVSLERTACFGSCPVYSVSIEADGTVRYNGIEHVAKLGMQQSQVGSEGMARLRTELQNAQFFKLRSQTKGSSGCRSFRSDHPSMTVQVVMPDDDSTVKVYTGCPESQVSITLSKLAGVIDEVANTSQWIE